MRWPGPAPNSGSSTRGSRVWYAHGITVCAALAAAVRVGADAGGSLPSQRTGLAPDASGQLAPALRDGPGGHRHAAGLARATRKTAAFSLTCRAATFIVPACRCRTRRAGCTRRLWLLESGTGGIGYVDLTAGALSQGRRIARVHARPGHLRRPRFRRPLAGARERGLQRHPDRREGARRAQLRRVGVTCVQANRGVPPFRGRGGRRCSRPGAARFALPGIGAEDPKLLADSYDLPSAALEDVPAPCRCRPSPAVRGRLWPAPVKRSRRSARRKSTQAKMTDGCRLGR